MDILNELIHLNNEATIDADVLETIRIKLTQLNESLNSFLNLDPHTPWPLILDKFNILISRYSKLLEVVSSKLLKECVIHPESLPEVDPDSLPRFLLRTKFIPEIEEMESKLIVSIAGDNNQYNWIDESEMKEVLKTWEKQITKQDKISEKAINFFENERKKKKYDFKKRIQLNEKRKRLRPELPRRRKHYESILKKRMLSSQSKLGTSPLSQTLSSSNLGTETEDSKSMLSETITDLGTITDSETSSVITESTNVVEEKDSDSDESNDDLTSKATSKIMSGDEDSVITSATGTTNLTSTTSITLNSSKLGSFSGAKRINRTSTLRNELDYNSESDYEDTYNYDESSSESEKETEKKEVGNDKKQENKKQKPKIGILENMIRWLERGEFE